jgi:hypothetical protein
MEGADLETTIIPGGDELSGLPECNDASVISPTSLDEAPRHNTLAPFKEEFDF